jgi:hypothetical protein
MEERNATLVDRIRTFINKSFGVSPVADAGQTSELIPAPANFPSVMGKALQDYYYSSLTSTRQRIEKYDRYNFLDENLAEAAGVLNVYADTIVAGSIGGEECFWFNADKDTPAALKTQVEELVKKVEAKTGIKEQIWDIARNTSKFGDSFYEVVLGDYGDGSDTPLPVKLKAIPVKECFADVDEYGVTRNAEKPYYQLRSGSDDKIYFDWWRLLHFKIGFDTYGVDRAIFANAATRIGRQLIWIDDALVLARMSRAWMRYAYIIDTSGLSPDQSFDYVDKFMKRVQRREIVDRGSGRITESDRALLPDEDIGLPVTKDGRTDVRTLSGDTNVSNVRDVEYLQNKFFTATNTPKAYVALEQDVNARATMTQLDVQFARQVRRKQMSLLAALKRFYEVVLVMGGIDPKSFKWDISFPELATMDELVKWQIANSKAQIAKIYAVDMAVLNTEWIMREILDFDDDEIAKYSAISPEEMAMAPGGGGGSTGQQYDQYGNPVDPNAQQGAAGVQPANVNTGSYAYTQLPPEMAKLIRKDPYLREALEQLHDLMSWRMAVNGQHATERIGIPASRQLFHRNG